MPVGFRRAGWHSASGRVLLEDSPQHTVQLPFLSAGFGQPLGALWMERACLEPSSAFRSRRGSPLSTAACVYSRVLASIEPPAPWGRGKRETLPCNICHFQWRQAPPPPPPRGYATDTSPEAKVGNINSLRSFSAIKQLG